MAIVLLRLAATPLGIEPAIEIFASRRCSIAALSTSIEIMLSRDIPCTNRKSKHCNAGTGVRQRSS